MTIGKTTEKVDLTVKPAAIRWHAAIAALAGTGATIVLLDLLDLAGLVGATLWDGQTGRFVTRELVAEAARDFQDGAAAAGSLLGAADGRKRRAALREDRVDRRQG